MALGVAQGGVGMDEAKGMLEKFARAGMEGPREHFRPMEGRPQQAGLPDQAGEMRPPQGMMPPQFQQQFEQRFQKFEQFRELEGQFRKPPEMMQNFQGPGGCQTPEQCIKYCSDPANRVECARNNPSTGALPPGEIFRQVEPGTERDFRSGSGGTTTPFGVNRQLPITSVFPATGSDSSVCPREFHPVCGTNNRTYPNECFAKKDNVSIAKEGPCGDGLSKEFRPEGIAPPEGFKPTQEGVMPPPDGFRPMDSGIMPPPEGFRPMEGVPRQPPQYIPQYTQPPVQPEQPTAPQSRRIGRSLLSNLLQAFSNALRMR